MNSFCVKCDGIVCVMIPFSVHISVSHQHTTHAHALAHTQSDEMRRWNSVYVSKCSPHNSGSLLLRFNWRLIDYFSFTFARCAYECVCALCIEHIFRFKNFRLAIWTMKWIQLKTLWPKRENENKKEEVIFVASSPMTVMSSFEQKTTSRVLCTRIPDIGFL